MTTLTASLGPALLSLVETNAHQPRAASPSLRIRAKRIGITGALILQLLTSTLWGVFLTIGTVYLVTRYLTDLGTFSLGDLVLWLDGRSEETRNALIGSALTIVGFLVAFQAATRNWQDAARAEMRRAAAGELCETYNEACRLITAIRIFAQNHLDAVEKIRARKSSPSGEFDVLAAGNAVRFALSQNEKFFSDRQNLTELHRASYNMIGRHFAVFNTVYRGHETVGEINDAVGSVFSLCWFTPPPAALIENSDWAALYLRYADVQKLIALRDQCDKAHDFVAMQSGVFRGALISSTAEVTIGFIRNFWQYGEAFLRAKEDLDNNRRPSETDFKRRFRFKW